MPTSKIGILILFLCIYTPILSQKGFDKFGNIPIVDLQMEVYEPEPSAVAVVLLNRGKFSISSYQFYVHKRIKVLKQAGTKYGNITLRVRSKGNIKASCFNLENGRKVEYSLRKSDIIEEKVTDGIIIYKLLVPNVKVGSVIELKYSYGGLPFEWNFQEMIPVRNTDLLIEESPNVKFSMSHFGNIPLQTVGKYHWIGKDLTSFKVEPYMTSIKNNIGRVEFELEKVNFYGNIISFATSWETVSERLLEFYSFGRVLQEGSPHLNKKAKELKKLDIPDDQKLKLAYNYVQEKIKWNGQERPFVSRDYISNFNIDHSGSVADINLSLIALLRKIEIEAYPIVLSTKKNGLLKKYKPSIDKLNYVVCLAKLGHKEILIDASSENTSIGVLPPKCLNGDGWLVSKGNPLTNDGWGKWIDLNPKGISFERSYAQIDLNSDGSSIATILKKQNLYDYYKWKKSYDKFNTDANYHRYLDEKYDDLEVLEYSSKINEDKMSVSERIKLDYSKNTDDFGNEIVINPFVFSIGLENPFKSQERITPIDLGYMYGLDRNITIKLPLGLRPNKLPEPMEISTEDGKAYFKFEAFTGESSITFKYSIIIKDPIINIQKYPLFKTFYSLMIDKLNESISLKKT